MCARAIAAALLLRDGRPCVFFDEFAKLPARTKINPHALAGRAVVVDRTHCGTKALGETVCTLKEQGYALRVIAVGPRGPDGTMNAAATAAALHGVWLRNIVASDMRDPVPDVAVRAPAGRYRTTGDLVAAGLLPGWNAETDLHGFPINFGWGVFVPDAKTFIMRARIAALPPPVEWCRFVELAPGGPPDDSDYGGTTDESSDDSDDSDETSNDSDDSDETPDDSDDSDETPDDSSDETSDDSDSD